jgi:predicted TPR repeat methyltransferase
MPFKPTTSSPYNAIASNEDGYLVYNLRSRELHRLNSAAAVLLELCFTPRTSQDIDKLAAALPGSDPGAWKRWLQQAIAQQLLIEGEPIEAPATADFIKAAHALRDEGQLLAAFICQEHATQLQPHKAAHWLALGELAHILGRRAKACDAYKQYLALNPDNAEAAHILVALQDQAPPSRAPDNCIQQLYSRFAGFYERNMCEELEYQGPERLHEVLTAVLADAKNLDILELGCGTGLAACYLEPRARLLTGIDLSPDMLAQARATGLYDELHAAEITAFLNTDSSFYQLIVACDTFIYFGDLKQVMEPAARHLTAHGWMIFTVEKGEVAPYMLADSGRYTHTEQYLRQIATDAGFEVRYLQEGFLRKEYGEPVTGLITALRKTT